MFICHPQKHQSLKPVKPEHMTLFDIFSVPVTFEELQKYFRVQC